jgi:5-methylcytosine-specific restriction endonuclease McrA
VFCKDSIKGCGYAIDRVDNSIREYTIENSVTCCSACNHVKYQDTLNDFKKGVTNVVAYNSGHPELCAYDFERDMAGLSFSKHVEMAGRKHRIVELTEEEFIQICSLGKCYYCGKEGTRTHPNGADRKFNHYNVYNKETIVCCCTRCNRAKFKSTPDEYLKHCKKISA